MVHPSVGGGRRDPTRQELKAYFPNASLAYHLHALPDHGLVYVKNPKAGCSTVLVWLSRLHSGDDSFSPSNVHTDHPLPRPPEVGWPRIRRMLGGAAYRFSFVRDPLKRVESAYRDKIATATSPRWRNKTRVTLGLPVTDDDVPLTFEQFIESVERQDPVAEMDPHWRPQHVNLMHPLITYDHVGRLESFDADIKTITREAGIRDVPAELRNVQSNAARGSVYEGRADLVARVRSIYATDFELYGY